MSTFYQRDGSITTAATDSAAPVTPNKRSDLLPCPREMFDILADLECALVMTRNYTPEATVGSFVDSSTQFKRLADFLHEHQHTDLSRTPIGCTCGERPGGDDLGHDIDCPSNPLAPPERQIGNLPERLFAHSLELISDDEEAEESVLFRECQDAASLLAEIRNANTVTSRGSKTNGGTARATGSKHPAPQSKQHQDNDDGDCEPCIACGAGGEGDLDCADHGPARRSRSPQVAAEAS